MAVFPPPPYGHGGYDPDLATDRELPVRWGLVVADLVDGLLSIVAGVVVAIAFWLVLGLGLDGGTTGILWTFGTGMWLGFVSVPIVPFLWIALTVPGWSPGIALVRVAIERPGPGDLWGWRAAGWRMLRYLSFLAACLLVFPNTAVGGVTRSAFAVMLFGLPVGLLAVSGFYLDLKQARVRGVYFALVPPILLVIAAGAFLMG